MNQTPRSPHRLVAGSALLALLGGCASSGLSPRETEKQNYSSFVYALYEQPGDQAGAREEGGDAARTPPRLTPAARVAVAQVGEVAPPQAFMDKLRARPEVFSRVEGISGMPGAGRVEVPEPPQPAPQPAYGYRFDQNLGAYVIGPPINVPATAPAPRDPRDHVRRDVAAMRRLARDMGMDYLLVLGGTVDNATTTNNLSILDLTIVGAFVVPSREINAKATAAAALVDAKTGRVLLTASADASKGGLATAASTDSGELDVLRKVRYDVANKLAESVLAECRRVQVAAAN
jgi:hypothetical protein